MFANVESATLDRRTEAFEALVRKLAIHETAEQEVVHPLARKAGAEGETDARLGEEKDGERAVAELQENGPGDPSFPEARHCSANSI